MRQIRYENRSVGCIANLSFLSAFFPIFMNDITHISFFFFYEFTNVYNLQKFKKFSLLITNFLIRDSLILYFICTFHDCLKFACETSLSLQVIC